MDTFANSVGPDETGRINELSHQDLQCLPNYYLFLTKLLLATMDESKFRDGCAGFRNSVTLTMLSKIVSTRRFEILFLFFPDNRLCNFKQIVKLHGMSKPIFWRRNIKITSACLLLNLLIEW